MGCIFEANKRLALEGGKFTAAFWQSPLQGCDDG